MHRLHGAERDNNGPSNHSQDWSQSGQNIQERPRKRRNRIFQVSFGLSFVGSQSAFLQNCLSHMPLRLPQRVVNWLKGSSSMHTRRQINVARQDTRHHHKELHLNSHLNCPIFVAPLFVTFLLSPGLEVLELQRGTLSLSPLQVRPLPMPRRFCIFLHVYADDYEP